MDELLLGFLPDPQAIPEPDEWLRRLGTLPLIYQPGERWLYNTGSDMLGVLIARATGMSLGEFMQERIFAPLGMKATGFSVPADKLDRLATPTGPISRPASSGSSTTSRIAAGATARLRIGRQRAGLDGRRSARLR